MLQRQLLKLRIYVRNRPLLPFLLAATVALAAVLALRRIEAIGMPNSYTLRLVDTALSTFIVLAGLWVGQWRRGWSLRLALAMGATIPAGALMIERFRSAGFDWGSSYVLSPHYLVFVVLIAVLALCVRATRMVHDNGFPKAPLRFSISDGLEAMLGVAICSVFLAAPNAAEVLRIPIASYIGRVGPPIITLAVFTWVRSAPGRCVLLTVIFLVWNQAFRIMYGAEFRPTFVALASLSFVVPAVWLAGLEVRRRGRRPPTKAAALGTRRA
ncbi:hypothetical protein Pla175_02890 [Pirellulimonas nuda]|uniref:Uncharacterized protein n=1 Tax=Pirellulimonas nuda TaxID=2528009 RepID=A0A518D636_9BACT|nr:hypothetical protein [Pirellulimonas nuda]QDU86935.1 hypothetical protein Pla175_02890 [Pirellulimonas nuda]